MSDKVIRIGGASGAFVDSAIAVPQLLTVPGIDYLIFDYLAEGSMGVFGRMQAMNPALGFMTDLSMCMSAPICRKSRRRESRSSPTPAA